MTDSLSSSIMELRPPMSVVFISSLVAGKVAGWQI